MIDDTEGKAASGFLLQVPLQEIPRDGFPGDLFLANSY
jgi:hypothetical protein